MGWRIYFQDDSPHGWRHEASVSTGFWHETTCNSKLFEDFHKMAAASSGVSYLRESRRKHIAFYDLVLVAIHHHFYYDLFIRSKSLNVAYTQKKEELSSTF